MKKLLLVLAAGMLFGCAGDKSDLINSRVDIETVSGNRWQSVNILTVDKCEYVVLYRSGKLTMTHKGNCKNHN